MPPAGDEISRLAQTLNEMLARLQAAVEHERRFVADASHELRTPLALLRTELDLALRRPRSREELESALRSAADETQRLSRLAEDLLLIARADQGPLPIRQEDVAVEDLLARRRDAIREPGELARARASSQRERAARRCRPASRRPGAREPRGQRPHARRGHGRASGRGARRLRRASRQRRRLRVSRPGSGTAPSTASAVPTRRAAAAGRGSGSRSWSSSPARTAAAPVSATPRREERTCGSRFRLRVSGPSSRSRLYLSPRVEGLTRLTSVVDQEA